MSEPLLLVEHLVKSFDGVDAVRDVSFGVKAGEVVAMIGPNGAGKTTCFNLIHGQLRPDTGEIRFDGSSVVGKPTHSIAHRGIARTFQIPATFASMTVREAVALSLIAKAKRDARVMAPPLRVRSTAIDDDLARLQIDDIADAHCGALAYGNAKRLEIALALIGAPKLLLMDEPTAGMAPAARRALMGSVLGLAREHSASVLFTEHDMDIVFGFAERVLVLDRGAIIADGSPQHIRDDPRVQAAYLG
ncbi:MAG TPA: ABC transporter ATP-binding protein [Casimicrobiaceae bacterium]|jgi:branched-chain amino acid transport system ATP-binding protein|nr:ABC transporter ATP-binding protein [Casimicrobiaceae bacterium]